MPAARSTFFGDEAALLGAWCGFGRCKALNQRHTSKRTHTHPPTHEHVDTPTNRSTHRPCTTAAQQLLYVVQQQRSSTSEKKKHPPTNHKPCVYNSTTIAAVLQHSSSTAEKNQKAETRGFELTLCLSGIERSTAEPKGNVFHFVFEPIFFSKLIILKLV